MAVPADDIRFVWPWWIVQGVPACDRWRFRQRIKQFCQNMLFKQLLWLSILVVFFHQVHILNKYLDECSNISRSQCHMVRRAQTYVLRAPASCTTVWPGDYIELSIPSVLDDIVVAIEPRNDYSPLCHQNWPEPAIVEAVGDKIRLVNTSGEPLKLRRNEHFCQVRHTVDTTTYSVYYTNTTSSTV